jgi:hypothetical protein
MLLKQAHCKTWQQKRGDSTSLNPFNPGLEQTTSSAPVFSRTKVWMGKYLKKSFFQNMLSALADDRLEQTTSSAPVFSKTKVRRGKYLKKSCSFYQAEQGFFKFVPKYVIRYSRRHWPKSKMASLGLNELSRKDATTIFAYVPTTAD